MQICVEIAEQNDTPATRAGSPAATCHMSNILFLLCLWTGVAVLALPTRTALAGTTYYVDATLGKDAYSGMTTIVNDALLQGPWRTIAKVNSGSFGKGDSILFRRGCTWREQLNVPSSGSIGSPITFGAYGTGVAPIINGSDVLRGWTQFNSDVLSSYLKSGITIKPNRVFYNGNSLIANPGATMSVEKNQWDWAANILYVNVGADPDDGMLEAAGRDYGININKNNNITLDGLNVEKVNVQGIGAIMGNYMGLTVENCSLNNATYGIKIYTYGGTLASITLRNNALSAISENLIDINGESGQTVTGILITGNSLSGDSRGTGSGMYLGGITGGTNLVDSNTITGVGEAGFWMQAWRGGTNTVSNNTISSWKMGTNDRGGIHPIGCMGGIYIFEHNTLHDDGGNGQGGALYMDTFSGSAITVRYNYVYNTKGPGLSSCQSSSVSFYYNILVNTGLADWGVRNSGSIEVVTWNGVNAHNNLFYNNIIYNNTAASGYGIFLGRDSGAGTLSGNTFKNNIIWHQAKSGHEYVKDQNDASAVFTNNLYWPAIGNKELNLGVNWYSTLAEWQAAGHDSASINANPLFVSAGSNFHLQPTSPAINAGTNVGLTSDYAGTSVPKGQSPDIGAYESQPLMAPRNLTLSRF
jgi:hypothetical protein